MWFGRGDWARRSARKRPTQPPPAIMMGKAALLGDSFAMAIVVVWLSWGLSDGLILVCNVRAESNSAMDHVWDYKFRASEADTEIMGLCKALCGHTADVGVGCGEPAVVVQPQA